MRKKSSTTKLPLSLQEQIRDPNETAVDNHLQTRGNHRSKSRKETRKQQRATQKQRKAAYFSHTLNFKKRPADDDHTESPQHKKLRHGQGNKDNDSIAKAETKKESPIVTPQASLVSQKTSASKLVSKPKKLSKGKEILKRPKSRAEEDEDTYISYLEAQLGIDKGKRRAKRPEEDDGLDDLMDWADAFLPSINEAHETFNDEKSDSDDNDEASSESHFELEEEWGDIMKDDSLEESSSSNPTENVSPDLTDEHTHAKGVYVPPHLRNAQLQSENNSEAIQKLSRQLKGLLNRLSEQNIGSILDSLEAVYRDHRRNDVTTTLTTLIITGISSHSSLLDSYVVLQAALISSLHKIVGIEFAAHFVQSTVSAYEDHFGKVKSTGKTFTEDEGKECSNLIVLISELYNFQVISCLLIFDIIRSLLSQDLTEFIVELLLKLVRNSGQQLRHDDPSALKDIIDIVQKKVATKDQVISSRTRFMLEALTNLKNNKLKRNVTQNQGGAAVERMKRFLSGLLKTKQVQSHDTLRVSLRDLHSAETKGKWWLVGAAWNGDPLVDKHDDFTAKKKSNVVIEDGRLQDESTDLIKLAKLQGMNSDIRRGIFVVLMSSDDYLDACERLAQLNLTEVQQREIIRVILHCCGNEKSYNPYYTLVGQQLCRSSHSYKITLQFSLWDFLRDLGETTIGGAGVIKNLKEEDRFDVKALSETRLLNVARAYAWWISKDSVTLLILKPVDFTLLKPQTQIFLQELLIQTFINSQRSTPLLTSPSEGVSFTRNKNAIEEIFIKASRVQTLAMGLAYFLTESFKINKTSYGEKYSKFLHWAVNVAKETLSTSTDLVPAF